MGELSHIRDILPGVLEAAAKACGKHGCLRELEHDGAHRNRHWEWLEGKEGSSAKRVSQGSST